MIQHLPKWILASVAQHFQAYKGSIDLILETEYDDTQLSNDTAFLYVDGPLFTPTTKDNWTATFEIVCLVATKCDERELYRHVENIGSLVVAFTPTIELFKYGSKVTDTKVSIGCAMRVKENDAEIITTHFGRSKTNKDVLAAQILSYYEYQFSI